MKWTALPCAVCGALTAALNDGTVADWKFTYDIEPFAVCPYCHIYYGRSGRPVTLDAGLRPSLTEGVVIYHG